MLFFTLSERCWRLIIPLRPTARERSQSGTCFGVMTSAGLPYALPWSSAWMFTSVASRVIRKQLNKKNRRPHMDRPWVQRMIKTEKILHLKSHRGRKVRVVREHYLRERVPCYSSLCQADCENGKVSSKQRHTTKSLYLTPQWAHDTKHTVGDITAERLTTEQTL